MNLLNLWQLRCWEMRVASLHSKKTYAVVWVPFRYKWPLPWTYKSPKPRPLLLSLQHLQHDSPPGRAEQVHSPLSKQKQPFRLNASFQEKKIPIYPTNLLPYPSRIPLPQLPKSFKQHRIHHWANRENPDLISCWWLQGRPTGTVHLCCSASSRLNLLKWVSHPSGCQRFVVWKYVLINSI